MYIHANPTPVFGASSAAFAPTATIPTIQVGSKPTPDQPDDCSRARALLANLPSLNLSTCGLCPEAIGGGECPAPPDLMDWMLKTDCITAPAPAGRVKWWWLLVAAGTGVVVGAAAARMMKPNPVGA